MRTPPPRGAEAAATSLQAMNPLVKVSAAPGSPDHKLLDPEFLGSFDLVVAAGRPLRASRAAGALCAGAGVKFMAAAVRGAGSYYLADLGDHTFKPKVGLNAVAVGPLFPHLHHAAPARSVPDQLRRPGADPQACPRLPCGAPHS